MPILLVSGSPRPTGHTITAVRALARQLEAAGLETEIIDLAAEEFPVFRGEPVPAIALEWRERVRASEASQRFFDLHFRELVADPIAAVRRLYARFDLELTPDAQRRMRDWHRQNPQGRHGEHRHSSDPHALS